RRRSSAPLAALSGIDALLDLGCDGSTRERLAHRALVLAAKTLGLPVIPVGAGDEEAVHALARLLGEKEV
nr:hypothetical protein [Actinomycetota bacterium]